MSRPPLAPPLLAAALAPALAFTLAGCLVGPDFTPPEPRTPAAWSARSSPSSPSQATARPVPAAAWWAGFNDPELTSLVQRAAQANLDLKQAALRISEARAQREATSAQLWPNLNGNASWQQTRLSESTPTGKLFTMVGQIPGLPAGQSISVPNPYSQYQLGFDASWELDLFGRVRRGVEAARASEAAAVEDSRDAELSLIAEVGVAVADLYPRLTLQAGGGYQSEDIGHLLDWASRFYQVGPQIELPIFDAGRRRANVRLQDARAREAAVAYAGAVLGALHDVDNALTAYDSEQTRRAALDATVVQNRTAVELAMDRYRSGIGSFLDVLDAQRTQQQTELQLADSTTSVSIDLVALYKSLGGGWDAPELAAGGEATAR